MGKGKKVTNNTKSTKSAVSMLVVCFGILLLMSVFGNKDDGGKVVSDNKSVTTESKSDVTESKEEVENKSESTEVKQESTEVKPEVEEVKEEDVIHTVDNTPTLSEVLSTKADMSPLYKNFVSAFEDKIIEFDGCITYLTNHNKYKTRYDILLSAGDYVDENTVNPGPTFKFKDVNLGDMGIKELFLPDYISIGSNIKIKAKVVSYNENDGILELDPVLITSR